MQVKCLKFVSESCSVWHQFKIYVKSIPLLPVMPQVPFFLRFLPQYPTLQFLCSDIVSFWTFLLLLLLTCLINYLLTYKKECV